MATLSVTNLGLDGVDIEAQPRIGDANGAVLHLLPGGVMNPEGFGQDLKDVYAFTAVGKNVMRGGHYHLVLNELFFPMSGTALWILSDFRTDSSTHGKTIFFIMGIKPPEKTFDFPCFTLDGNGFMPRLRVPAGIYHAVIPLTDERMVTFALGSTGFQKEDYCYPTPKEVPEMKAMLQQLQITLPQK